MRLPPIAKRSIIKQLAITAQSMHSFRRYTWQISCLACNAFFCVKLLTTSINTMNKNLFYLFVLMAVAAMPLTSCEKGQKEEEQGQHDPASDADQIEIAGYDGLWQYLNRCQISVFCGVPFFCQFRIHRK